MKVKGYLSVVCALFCRRAARPLARIASRCSDESFARPFGFSVFLLPPSLPSATAAGFFRFAIKSSIADVPSLWCSAFLAEGPHARWTRDRAGAMRKASGTACGRGGRNRFVTQSKLYVNCCAVLVVFLVSSATQNQ